MTGKASRPPFLTFGIRAAAQHLLSVKLQSQILVSEATFMSPWPEEQTNIPNGTGGSFETTAASCVDIRRPLENS